jgi:hypothetical protein
MNIYTRKNPVATAEAASKCTHITRNMYSNIYSSITMFVLAEHSMQTIHGLRE